jgi:uncharacterized membrane protein YphA (DoxX/SURF4 family)
MMLLRSDDGRRRLALLAARLFMGGLFVSVWGDNLLSGKYWTSGYARFVHHYAVHTHLAFYRRFMDHVVIPHANVFSKAQLVAELLVIGVPLLVGLFTPVAGVAAAGFALFVGLAAVGTPGEWAGTYAMLFLLPLMLALSQAGRTLGVDALLARRNPHPRLPIY